MTADKEKRRAISREAAKKRRRVESDVFGNLSQLLPVQPSVQKSLDKPSIIRLTLSYIRMHTLLKDRNVENGHTLPPFAGLSDGGEEQRSSSDGGCGDVEPAQTEELKTVEETDMILSVLEGFLMVLTAHGDIIYLSDNVSKYMGLSQGDSAVRLHLCRVAGSFHLRPLSHAGHKLFEPKPSELVLEESVCQQSVQVVGQRWRLRLGGDSQCCHPHHPPLQVQTQRLSSAPLHPLCDLCSQWGRGAVPAALCGPDFQKTF